MNRYRIRFKKVVLNLSTLFCFLLFLSLGMGRLTSVTGQITNQEVTLEVAAPRIIGFGQFFVASSAPASVAQLPSTDINGQELDPNEFFHALFGSGRPGAKGDIMIEGIGLSGTTGIIFEGTGVSGEVDIGPEEDLNPHVIVRVRIEPWAEPGPRRFTLLTPRGEVHSGDVVFMVREPSVLLIEADAGAPGTSGYVNLFGVGLDQTQEIRFEGEGVRVRDFILLGTLNPSIFLRLDIDSTAPLGPRRFSVVTAHGVIESQAVTFTVTNPRITGISDSEGAPGTSGIITINGVGLCDTSAINFSGTGVTGTVRPLVCNDERVINIHIRVEVTIAPDAPLGPRTFTLTIPRGPGTASSAEADVTLTVTPPRIDALTETEAAPGARGSLYISGVGIGQATQIQFEGSEDIAGSVRRIGAGVLRSLNAPVTVDLTIAPTATLGPRRFTLTLPNGTVDSGALTFTVSSPRITSIDTRGDLYGDSDPPTAVAPGTSGRMRMYGLGLSHVVGVRFSGEGVAGTLEPIPPQGPALNPFIRVSLTVSPTAVLGERTIELILADQAMTLTNSSP